jgi:hypothetical protein
VLGGTEKNYADLSDGKPGDNISSGILRLRDDLEIRLIQFRCVSRNEYSLVSIYGSTALVELGRFFQYFNIYTVGSTSWMGISPLQGRYLPIGQHKHRINAYRHPCFEWGSSPQSRCLSGRTQFMP